MMMANMAGRIDEVVRGPVLVVEAAPDHKVAVDRDRVVDFEVANGAPHIVDALLESEFRRMHADHHQTLILVFLRPGFDVGNGTQAVDAGIGPEVDQHDLAAQRLRRQWRRVQPFDDASQRRQVAFDKQLIRRTAPRLRRHRRAVGLVIFPEGIEQALFEHRRAGDRNPGEKTRVESKGYDHDSGQDGNTQTTHDPFAGAQRTLTTGENPYAYQKTDGNGSGG